MRKGALVLAAAILAASLSPSASAEGYTVDIYDPRGFRVAFESSELELLGLPFDLTVAVVGIVGDAVTSTSEGAPASLAAAGTRTLACLEVRFSFMGFSFTGAICSVDDPNITVTVDPLLESGRMKGRFVVPGQFDGTEIPDVIVDVRVSSDRVRHPYEAGDDAASTADDPTLAGRISIHTAAVRFSGGLLTRRATAKGGLKQGDVDFEDVIGTPRIFQQASVLSCRYRDHPWSCLYGLP